MSKEQAKSYLNELKVPNRWSLVTIFQTMPLRAWNMKNSKNWEEFKEKKEVKEYIEKNQRTDPGVPRFFEAYYLCVKDRLLDWCIASEWLIMVDTILTYNLIRRYSSYSAFVSKKTQQLIWTSAGLSLGVVTIEEEDGDVGTRMGETLVNIVLLLVKPC